MLKAAVIGVLSVTLTTMTFAAPQPQAPPKLHARYQKLITMSAGIAIKAKALCKTEECRAQADALNKVISEGQTKLNTYDLTGEARKQFHADFETSMNALLFSLRKQQAEKPANPEASKYEGPINDLLAKQKEGCRAPRFKNAETEQECSQLCEEVLEQLSEICALYGVISPEAAIICLGAAAIGFGSCLNKCGQQCEGLTYPGATGNPCG